MYNAIYLLSRKKIYISQLNHYKRCSLIKFYLFFLLVFRFKNYDKI